MEPYVATAPGRICLLGEDQDYLGLPVITAGVSLKVWGEAYPGQRGKVRINFQRIGNKQTFPSSSRAQYRSKRDYARSSYNVFWDLGLIPPNFGLTVNVNGTLPIGKGMSSSSALSVMFVGLFSHALSADLSSEELARLAFKAEVTEFNEPGGIMDHFATSFGNTLYLECKSPYRHEQLDLPTETFIIGDTGIKKRTLPTLGRRKKEILKAISSAKPKIEDFNLATVTEEQLESLQGRIGRTSYKRLWGAIGIRDLVAEGYKASHDYAGLTLDKLGSLMNKHHSRQRDGLENVIPEMEEMVIAARSAGAVGAKLVGSGHGGSFLCIAERHHRDAVIEAIASLGATPHVVHVHPGFGISRI